MQLFFTFFFLCFPQIPPNHIFFFFTSQLLLFSRSCCSLGQHNVFTLSLLPERLLGQSDSSWNGQLNRAGECYVTPLQWRCDAASCWQKLEQTVARIGPIVLSGLFRFQELFFDLWNVVPGHYHTATWAHWLLMNSGTFGLGEQYNMHQFFFSSLFAAVAK